MPTAMDRVQVLLQPNEYAELKLCAKEERRSLAAMSAVLIMEALQARMREGTFIPNPNDEAYIEAKERQTRRQLGVPVERSNRVTELMKNKDFRAAVIKKMDEEGSGVNIDDVIDSFNEEGEATFEEKKAAISALSADDPASRKKK